MNKAANPLSYLRVLLQADLQVLLRSKVSLIGSLLVPLYILFITSRQGGGSKLGGSAFIVAIAITIGLMSSSLMGYAIIVARDREHGVFQRLRVTPAPTWVIMSSRLLSQVLINLATTIIFLIVGSRIHNLSFSASDYVWALLVSILAGAVFLAIGQALVGIFKSSTVVNSISRLLYIALLLTGLLGPSGELGTTLQDISKWTPVGTVLTVFEGALHQISWNGHTWLSLLACFGYVVVCAAIGIKWFQWDAR